MSSVTTLSISLVSHAPVLSNPSAPRVSVGQALNMLNLFNTSLIQLSFFPFQHPPTMVQHVEWQIQHAIALGLMVLVYENKLGSLKLKNCSHVEILHKFD
ncbi:hypothetical protein MTR_7g100300 [Medicago truncatula]|uniref:Uncharacterized protein n=1 Tax=Medicago truncatula TaxID=3880 RepID=G7L0P6_MEDTR|nr:hypothetical protein MTR_7g100300 [Medicago truncatula]